MEGSRTLGLKSLPKVTKLEHIPPHFQSQGERDYYYSKYGEAIKKNIDEVERESINVSLFGESIVKIKNPF